MENSYEINISVQRKLVSVKPYGEYDLRGIQNLIDEIIKNPRFDPSYDIILDQLDTKYSPLVGEIYELCKFLAKRKSSFQGKTAIIIENDVLHNLYKLATMFMAKEGMTTYLFKTVDEALDWLET